MKAWSTVLAVLIVLLLLGTGSRAGSDRSYVIRPGIASGGHYRLTGLSWQARGAASGGGYRLAGPLSPTGTGTPCCCTYLPCTLRNY